ncbi:sirohydrochlorin chelatase [Leptolyngbya sp. GGD]|uniref:sirohydrochlorin chelatase n=1 Tax=Leptolyngbya sp. GGD TaxID=2997907 RepID=UPI00227C3673|nr:sirohydrochlorin chelatase [Leptolyngbya sp. GGD]MCY6490518.1 sirohydrochlorin chelatase [Leptolyngbya sp. GGD]
MRSAYLLVTHGSRDIRPQIAIDQLRDRIEQQLSTPVGAAVLECAPTPLHEQIEEFSRQHPDLSQIQIVPLFLLPGVHVMEDIPEQIAIARSNISAELKVMPHLGSYAGLEKVLAKRIRQIPSDARILLSHGSRRPGGNAVIEELATAIDAVSAYWSVEPKLDSRLAELQGCQEIVILPYFLFSGGITDAISASVQTLAEKYPDSSLHLLSAFDFCEDLVNLIVEWIAPELAMRSTQSASILR